VAFGTALIIGWRRHMALRVVRFATGSQSALFPWLSASRLTPWPCA